MQVKVGDLVKIVFWAKVESVKSDYIKPGHVEQSVDVKDVDSEDFGFAIRGKELVEKVVSADHYSETVRLPHTKLVSKLVNAGNQPFTVKFTKKDGSMRILRGRLIGADQVNLGYVDVEDLDQPLNDRFRKVDCRTIYELIINGVQNVRK
jgi:hypothetical protein